VSEDEAAALSPSVIGHGADIVSQGSAPASSSRTAHSPTLSDSLRDSAADRPLASPPSVADAASEDEAAALSPSVIGHGADIVSQGSAPASSSRTAHSPTLSDSLRDSAADRPLASPPSVADAASEDEAAALSREAPGAGCNDEKEDMARATAILAHTTSPYYGRESRRLRRHSRRVRGRDKLHRWKRLGSDA